MPGRVRLAFFVDSLHTGGSELNAIRTLERLDRSRFDITVFHLGAEGPLLARYSALGVPMVRVALRSFHHPSALRAGWQFRRELRARRIQVLHAHDIYSNIFAVPWARLAGTPVVIASKRWHQAVPSRLHAAANRLASRGATAVLANSEAVARSLREEDGVAARRIEVIPNFVDAAAFMPPDPARRSGQLAGWGVPPGARVVGVVARLSDVKDHATFLRAMVPVVERFPDVHGLLLGEGPHRPAIEALVGQLGLAGRVHLAGEVAPSPNPHGWLDLSVLTSRTEGFPNSLVEAMAAGRPVVATRVGGVPDAVVHGETGLLVPPADPAALTTALGELLENPGRAAALGAAGRLRAEALYHVDRVIPRLAAWYESLLAAA